MKIRKLAALICAAAMTVSLLVGCKENSSEPDKPTHTTTSAVLPSGTDIPGIYGDRDSVLPADALLGTWTYIHDKETPVLAFSANRNAIYDGKLYTYDADGKFFTLTDTDGNQQSMRYVLDNEGMLFYKKTVYEYSGEGKPDGLLGVWECAKDNWSFEFTEYGTFSEDGYFPGYYQVDEAASTIKLIYNDHFEDTICFYQIDGNKLIIEYPWRMVKVA